MTEDSHHSLFGLIVAVAVGVVLGGLALSMALWVLGGLLHILFFLARIAVIVAIGYFVVWMLSRRREHSRVH